MFFRSRINRHAILTLASVSLLLPAAPSTRAAELERLLAGFDNVQESIQTLSARFTETTVNRLFKEPVVAEGSFYLTKPDAIRWEYSAPEEMKFVIARDQYTGYFPAQKRAEKRNIQRWSERLFRFFGLGQGSTELSRFYDISLGETQADDTFMLVLQPRKRRARKRVEQVLFWVNSTDYLPRKIEYQGQDGNSRVIDFHEVLVNPDLAATLYSVEIPSDVTVTRGFTGLPDFNPDPAQ